MSATKLNGIRLMTGKKGDDNARELPIESIIRSETNREIDTTSEAFQDFLASVKQWGVIQPIVVRRVVQEDGDASFYKLLAGERRWLASKMAGRTTILGIVRPDVNDTDALALQISENLQREDLSPLLLAEKVFMLKEMGKTTGELARLLGKSEKRISDILCQLNLIKPLRQIYESGKIYYGHVMYVARLTPVFQETALRALFRISSNDRRSTEELTKEILHGDHFRAIPEKELREWVSENVNLKLKAAAWNLEDAELVPEAGPCSTCPKRSINNPALYEQLAGNKDLCMDAACYKTKSQAFVKIQKAKAAEDEVEYLRLSEKESHSPLTDKTGSIKRNQWVPAKKGECKNTAQGIMMDGPSAGKKVWVCIDQKCKTHDHRFIWNTTPAPKPSPEVAARQRAQEETMLEAENGFRREAHAKLIASQPDPARILRAFMQDMEDSHVWPRVAEWLGWTDIPASGNWMKYIAKRLDGLDTPELARVLALVRCAEVYDVSKKYWDVTKEHEEAARFFAAVGLDTKHKSAAATA